VTRLAAGLALTVLLVGCACTRDASHEALDARTGSASLQVDPMVFVMIYRTDFERLLQKHADDCESALAALMRFVADHRQAFWDQVRNKPTDWQPRQARSSLSVELLMDFGSRCPDQINRLNQTIHSVTRLDDS
jgi:hypothetical protein